MPNTYPNHVRRSFDLDPETAEALDRFATEIGRTDSDAAAAAIRETLQRRGYLS